MPAKLNTRKNIFVLIDEAHRTTGGDLGNCLMAGLPNASFIGFTGTPVDKTAYGKGTFKTFGCEDDKGYLHKYSIAESIQDGTTLSPLLQPGAQPHASVGNAFRLGNGEEFLLHDLVRHLDSKKARIAAITGHLTREVKFGGGMLGHLDKGGEFEVKQAEVAPGYWELTLLNVQMKGKALFFKTISVQQKYSRSSFKRVPDDLTIAQAAEILRTQVGSHPPASP